MTGGMRMMAGVSWAGWMLASAEMVCAQVAKSPLPAPAATTPAVAAPAQATPDTKARAQAQAREADALEARLPKPKAEGQPDFDLSEARQQRLAKFLPNSTAILSQREPYHILAVGDGVFDLWKEEGAGAQPAFPVAFARELTAQFFYTGGVYEIGDKGADQVPLGPSIGVRQVARPGGCVLDAPRIVTTTAQQMKVNLVLLCYGQGEAAMGMSPVAFTHAVQEAVDAAKTAGADVILCGPWLQAAERSETLLGVARPLTDALREIAAQEGVLFVDLGDLSRMNIPEPTQADEGRVFDGIERTYRGFFHAETGGRFTPRAALHGQLGHALFDTLLNGAAAVPWKISAAVATLAESDKLSVEFQIENTTDATLDATVLPLIASGWKPLETTPLVRLPANGKQLVTVQYARLSPDAAPVQEPVVRLPVLITAGARARVEDLRAAVRPVAIVWTLDTLFNQEGSFSAGCQLVNNSTQNMPGKWQAEWNGKKLEGRFDLKPNGVLPLDLHFDLPADVAAAQVLPLALTVDLEGGINLTAKRQVEIIRNVGLDQAISLRPLDGTKSAADEVTLKATATAKEIAFSFALARPEIFNDAPADGSPAWQLEVNLDARSYGKRLERGSTATLQATGSAADGVGVVHAVAPWCFGNDYAATFDPKEFKTSLTTSADGKRLIRFTIPRTYLYLHEWALNNGNSQMGLNVRLTFRRAPIGAPASLTTYALTVNTNQPEDVESLAVLELAKEPTKRVTISVY